MKARWWHVGALAVGAAVAAACGASGTAAPRAPSTATLTPAPTPTPTVVPASSSVLDGWQTRLWIINGCECAGPPAAGLIDVQMFPPVTTDIVPLKWRVSHPSLARPVKMPMVREMLSLDPCAPKDEPPPILSAYHAWFPIPDGDIVPSGPGFDVSVLVRDRAGKELWVQVQPTKVCGGVS